MMMKALTLLHLLFLVQNTVRAQEYSSLYNTLEDYEFTHQFTYGRHPCNYPFYSKNDVPGSQRDGSMETNVPVEQAGTNPHLTVMFYPFNDRHRIGRPTPDQKKVIFCSDEAVEKKYCQDKERYRFLINPPDDPMDELNPSNRGFASIEQFTRIGRDQLSSNETMEYTVLRKGLYCVLVKASAIIMKKPFEVYTKQPFGYLNALSYPLLPFYGVLSLVYLVLAIVWMIRSAFFWRDILPIQHIVAGLFLVLMLDNAFYFGLYEHANSHEEVSTVLFGFTCFLNALRTAASIFVVLIVSMGYGVVRPSLGTDMRKCIGISVALFIALFVYNFYASFSQRRNPMTALLIVVPLALTMTLSFYWIISGLGETIIHLEERRQQYKLSMYTWLRRVLLLSIVVLFFGTLVSGIVLARMFINVDAFNTGWSSLWFYDAGWTKLVYFFSFICLAWLWRPTKNNQRYGLEQLPDDDHIDLEARVNPEFEGRDVHQRNNTGRQESHVLFDASDSEQPRQVYAIGDELDSPIMSDDEEKMRAQEISKIN